jgi:hypothetical protein
MLRKAAVLAAEADGDGDGDGDGAPLTVRDEHVAAAIDELMVAGGTITRRLLGVAGATASAG